MRKNGVKFNKFATVLKNTKYTHFLTQVLVVNVTDR